MWYYGTTFHIAKKVGEDDDNDEKQPTEVEEEEKFFHKNPHTEIDLLTTSFLMGCVCSLIVDGKISGVLTWYRLTPKMVMLLLMTILTRINYFDFFPFLLLILFSAYQTHRTLG